MSSHRERNTEKNNYLYHRNNEETKINNDICQSTSGLQQSDHQRYRSIESIVTRPVDDQNTIIGVTIPIIAYLKELGQQLELRSQFSSVLCFEQSLANPLSLTNIF